MLFRYLNDLVITTMVKLKKPQSELVREEPFLAAPLSPQAHPTKEPAFHTHVHAAKGDITKYPGDAIVNAANAALMPGGGVCGAIFAAAQYDALEEACSQLGGCPTGSAKATPSYGLPAHHIIHAVGPVYDDGTKNEADLLASAYTESLHEAHRVGAKSIAFPAISTGIYGYPLEDATKIAIRAIQDYTAAHPTHFHRIDFLCFDDKTLALYQKHLTPIEQEQERKYHVVQPLERLSDNASEIDSIRIRQWYIGSHAKITADPNENTARIAMGEQVVVIPLTPTQLATLHTILEEENHTVRIRRAQTSDQTQWYLTLKGKGKDDAVPEVEAVVTPHTAEWMLEGATGSLEKIRHRVKENGYLWEVDQFQGLLKGLVIAELENKQYPVFPPAQLPAWIGEDITQDVRYKNARMAKLNLEEATALVHDSHRTTSPRFGSPTPS